MTPTFWGRIRLWECSFLSRVRVVLCLWILFPWHSCPLEKVLPLWETRPLWLACYHTIWNSLWSLLYLETPLPQVMGEAAFRTRNGSQAGSDAGWGDREPPSSDSNLLFPLLKWGNVSFGRWVLSLKVCFVGLDLGKKYKKDKAERQWSYRKEQYKTPLGDKKLFWALCFSPSPIHWMSGSHSLYVQAIFYATQTLPLYKRIRDTQTAWKTRHLLLRLWLVVKAIQQFSLIGLIWYHSF